MLMITEQPPPLVDRRPIQTGFECRKDDLALELLGQLGERAETRAARTARAVSGGME
jgi:hypothetical protein